MSFDVLARLIHSALREFDRASFVWHGGEPTLLPISFLEKALVVEHRFRKPGQVVRNYLQTNGTRLTPQWGAFLARAGFTVGLSLDGPAEIHDRSRRNVDGRPSFAQVLAGFDVLHQHQVPTCVLVVVDRETIEWGAQRLFEFFAELGERGARRFACLAASPPNQPHTEPGATERRPVDPLRMAEFLIELYDRWLEHGDPRFTIRPLDAIRHLLDGGTSFCFFAGGCFGHLFQVEPSGKVTACDLFQGDERYTLGELAEQDFAAVLASPSLQRVRRQLESDVARSCGSCPELAICRGGCAHVHYLSAQYAQSLYGDRCSLRPLIEHVRARQPAEDELWKRFPQFVPRSAGGLVMPGPTGSAKRL